MSSDMQIVFTKENIDTYLKEIAKEYRKQIGKKMPAELILIGGASVLINYGFRDMTTDIDAVIHAASAMKDVISKVGEKYELPAGWLNEDFTSTASYSQKLVQYSTYYKTFSNVLTVRTIAAEYLIAMKLRSGRQYKSDLSDILGILTEHEKAGKPITIEVVKRAAGELYGDFESLPETSKNFIVNVMQEGNLEGLYEKIRTGEKETKELLIRFEQDYPGVTKETNVNEISDNLQKKASEAEILQLLMKKR